MHLQFMVRALPVAANLAAFALLKAYITEPERESPNPFRSELVSERTALVLGSGKRPTDTAADREKSSIEETAAA